MLLVLLAGLAGAGWLAYGQLVRRVRRAESVKAVVYKRLAEMENQALRAQMNPHFIFNSLNSINWYIVKADPASASLYLTRFAKLIWLILDHTEAKSIALSDELEALKLYIEMERLRFDEAFSYEICIAGKVYAETAMVPPLILQPYVENAIWHGLLHLPKPGHLRIEIGQVGDCLTCAIEDNGIGRNAAAELHSKSATKAKSMGSKLTEERIKLLNRDMKGIVGGVAMHDLLAPDGTAAGTRVVLTIPQ